MADKHTSENGYSRDKEEQRKEKLPIPKPIFRVIAFFQDPEKGEINGSSECNQHTDKKGFFVGKEKGNTKSNDYKNSQNNKKELDVGQLLTRRGE